MIITNFQRRLAVSVVAVAVASSLLLSALPAKAATAPPTPLPTSTSSPTLTPTTKPTAPPVIAIPKAVAAGDAMIVRTNALVASARKAITAGKASKGVTAAQTTYLQKAIDNALGRASILAGFREKAIKGFTPPALTQPGSALSRDRFTESTKWLSGNNTQLTTSTNAIYTSIDKYNKAEAAKKAAAAKKAREAAAAKAAAAKKAAAWAAVRRQPVNHDEFVWTSGFQNEIDQCRGSVNVTAKYGVKGIAEHWRCGGRDFPTNVGARVRVHGAGINGVYEVRGIVARLSVTRNTTSDIPRGYDLVYQTCWNGNSQDMTIIGLKQIG